MSKRILCQVFRSPRREGMYLYVPRDEGIERVPESLMAAFGTPEPALLLMLEPTRKLARADVAVVLRALADEGYYLQMPPSRYSSADSNATGEGYRDDANEVHKPC